MANHYNIYSLKLDTAENVLTLKPSTKPGVGTLHVNTEVGSEGTSDQQWREDTGAAQHFTYMATDERGNVGSIHVPIVGAGQKVETSTDKKTGFIKQPTGKANQFRLVIKSGGIDYALQAPTAIGGEVKLEPLDKHNDAQTWIFGHLELF